MSTATAKAPSVPKHTMPPVAPATPPSPPSAPATATAVAAVAPKVLGVNTSLTMPKLSSNRGSKSIYNFDAIPLNGSVGVINRSAADLQSTINGANRRYKEAKKAEDGSTVFKTKTLTAPDGTKSTVNTDEPVMVAVKHFFAADCDENDPEGATSRIWRDL